MFTKPVLLESYWRRVIYFARHSLTSVAWNLIFMPSLEEYRLWSSRFHCSITTRNSQDYEDIWSHLSIRTTRPDLLHSGVDQTNIKSRSRFSFAHGHNQEPHRMGGNSWRQTTNGRFGCNWIKESEIIMISANTWIPAAAASEKKVATAVMCVMPDPVSLIESAGKGRDLGKGGDVGSQMKSFIRWLLNYSAVPSTAQGCQLVSLQNQN